MKIRTFLLLLLGASWVAMIFTIGFLLCLAITFDELKAGWGLLDRLESMEAGEIHGFYSYEYRYILCNVETSCLHEVAHWKDDNSDWISVSPEFQEAVDSFIASCTENKDTSYYCRTFIDFPGLNGNPLRRGYWGGHPEIYAKMYMNNFYYREPIPDIFLEFYH